MCSIIVLLWPVYFAVVYNVAQMGGRLCSNGECVARDLWCDGAVDNSGDGTDEDITTAGVCGSGGTNSGSMGKCLWLNNIMILS